MFVLSERNIVTPAPDGSAAVRLRAGMMETIPDRATGTDYFQALIKDGKVVPSGTSDEEGQKVAEKEVKTRQGAETTEEWEAGAAFYWDQPQFYGVRAATANLGSSAGNYTAEQFQEGFPQFFTGLRKSLLPRTMLDKFVRQANAAIQPDKRLDGWRHAAGLYTTHYTTLCLRTYAPSSETPGQVATTEALMGVVASAKPGQDSVTCDTGALTKVAEDWGDLNVTQYGQLLATKARLVGTGGSYILWISAIGIPIPRISGGWLRYRVGA